MAGQEYDVFLSHAFEDTADARWIRQVLQREGWRTFLAADDLEVERESTEWSRRIDDTLNKSRLVVVLVSPVAAQSRWVDHEWRSVHKDLLSGRPGPKTIIPCCIRDVAPYELDRALRDYDAIDLRERQRRPEIVKKLLELIAGTLQRPLEPGKRSKLVRILSIEGGGTRSLIPGRVLVSLEEKIQRIRGPETRIADCFDLLAGVSASSILAALLATRELSAATIVTRYRELLPRSFVKNVFFPFLSKTKYRSNAPFHVLSDIFKDRKLSELATACLIPTYDLMHREPRLLKQQEAKANTNRDMKVVDAVMAAVAAPLYFAPRPVIFPDRLRALLVDGCLYARNPTDLAFKEASDLYHPRPAAEDVCILSLGTGESPVRNKPPQEWGVMDSIAETINISMDGAADLVHSTFLRMYETMGRAHQYVRVDPEISVTGGRAFRMDDTAPETLDELERIGDELAVIHDAELEQFVQLLEHEVEE